ncbi:MAG: MerR family transcriptional regulator [Stackebrandtia sp.]
MNLISIGEAARRLGVRTSTLRYYEDRRLVHPAARVNGQRRYGQDELRRLAFLQTARKLGIPLDTVAAVLDEDSARWREAVGEQIAGLDALIARARGARDFLSHALECPADHPVPECPHMTQVLDRLVDGMPFDELVAEHTEQFPPRP